MLGGVIGMLIVDPATGAMWTLDTSEINATLKKATTTETPTLEILNINDVPENMKQHLVKIN